jgi:kalirin
MQEEPNLPELLQGKERMIFGNVAAIYDFHRDVFQGLIDKAKDSQEEIAQCFLEKRSDFKLYVTYCENKPKSESFIWTYTHHGGTFFTEVQKKLGLREDIASFLIKPVQRITKYQLLLKDLLRTSQKAGKEVPLLEEALQLMQDVPKQANDAMALSMIIGYHGNIHANGQIILQDEFTVYEKSRWAGGARRHVFLLDLMMIITKDKDNDGLYEFKDSLKVHNMTLTEKQADNPCRFTVGTGQIGDWDKFYILEASTSEKKQEWIKTIKEILNQQFEMLKALKQPSRARSTTVDNPIDGPAPSTNVIQLPQQASIFHDMSDSSLDEASDEEEQPSPLTRKRSGAMSTSGPDQQEVRKNPPFAKVDSLPGSLPKINAFVVSEDYTPTAEGQKILHIKKGQVYNVMNSNGNWWWGRLIRRLSFGDIATTGAEGWIPHNFLDQFTGQLTSEEQFNCLADKVSQNNSDNKFWTLPSKINKANSVKANSKPDNKKKFSKKKNKQPLNPPQITAGLSDESVLIGQDVQFKCQLAQEYTDQKVEWFLNGKLFSNERAFISSSNICILKIKYVNREDEGLYMCSISSQGQCSSTSAKLTVLGPPDPPGIPRIKQITSTSVSLTWTPPMFDGHSPVTIYLVECKDTLGDRWSTLMKRITEPSTIVDDLIPRMEYIFRVLAGNHIGSSQPSLESKPIKMTHNSSFKPVFSLEPFENHYTLMGQIAKGQYSQVYECLHEATQQIYIAKLLPLSLGSNQCHNELMLLSQISHPNIILMTSAYLTDKHYIIVMKYVNGSPIFDYFMQKKTSTELVVSKCCQQLTDALDYLHQMNIAHLAIKVSQ